NNNKEMSFFSHLGELRSRLIKSLLSVTGIFFVALGFSSEIINILEKPLKKVLPAGAEKLYFTGPLDVLFLTIKVAFISAIVIGSPIWIYQFWKFIEPGLYPKEKKYVLPFAFATIILFFLGISFSFFIFLPYMLEFLIQMGSQIGVPIITITDYISMLLVFLLSFGLVFETPVILILLGMLGIITPNFLSRKRRHVFVIILIASAVLTPTTDPISQLAMAIPMYAMFELSILILIAMKKKREKDLVPAEGGK
ncbi:MAG: twin-arginine translocase subunit TatC, partial [Oligoflexales bacterium]|nr:twin-arginine translocase subunit TatC [Oligoflexales bacterium]